VVNVVLRFIFYAILFWAIYYAVKGLFGGGQKPRGSAKGEEDAFSGEAMIACPECETYFPAGIGVPGRIRGSKYLFCAEECAERFKSRGGPPREESPPDSGRG
jgi:hypothetical protein